MILHEASVNIVLIDDLWLEWTTATPSAVTAPLFVCIYPVSLTQMMMAIGRGG